LSHLGPSTLRVRGWHGKGRVIANSPVSYTFLKGRKRSEDYCSRNIRFLIAAREFIMSTAQEKERESLEKTWQKCRKEVQHVGKSCGAKSESPIVAPFTDL
jgi:hypothetical protein